MGMVLGIVGSLVLVLAGLGLVYRGIPSDIQLIVYAVGITGGLLMIGVAFVLRDTGEIVRELRRWRRIEEEAGKQPKAD